MVVLFSTMKSMLLVDTMGKYIFVGLKPGSKLKHTNDSSILEHLFNIKVYKYWLIGSFKLE